MAHKASVTCTPREERFCQEFIIDLNGAASARRIGISSESAPVEACKMLKRKRVSKRIEKLQEERSLRVHLTQDRVLEEYIILALSDLKEYMTIEGGVLTPKSFEEMGPMKSRALKKIKQDRIIKESADGKQMVVHDIISFETHDKKGTLDFLAKHLGMEGGIGRLEITSPEIGKMMTLAHIALQKEKQGKKKNGTPANTD